MAVLQLTGNLSRLYPASHPRSAISGIVLATGDQEGITCTDSGLMDRSKLYHSTNLKWPKNIIYCSFNLILCAQIRGAVGHMKLAAKSHTIHECMLRKWQLRDAF